MKPRFTLSVMLTLAPLAAPAATPAFHYEHERLSAQIAERPLQEVLRALGEATGARFTLSDPAIGTARITVLVEAAPFAEGVKQILEGYSYALYPVEGAALPAVIVLSTLPTETARAAAAGHVPDKPPVSAVFPPASPINDPPAPTPTAEPPSSAKPGLAVPEPAVTGVGPAAKAPTAIPSALLPTLELIAKAEGPGDSQGRAQSAAALWHLASARGFAEPYSTGALERLAGDPDPEVQRIGRRAVAELERHRREEARESAGVRE